MLRKSTYVQGRFLCLVAIVAGYAIPAMTAIGVAVMAMRGESRHSIAIAIGVAAACVLVSVANHGLWQVMLAMFDVADEARMQRQIAEETQQYLKDTVQALTRSVGHGGRNP
jgi:NhaP-type Na+/H+ or K+/H+ antiporter